VTLPSQKFARPPSCRFWFRKLKLQLGVFFRGIMSALFSECRSCSSEMIIFKTCYFICRSMWQRGLRSANAAAGLLGLRVRIPSGTWISFCCVVYCQVEIFALGWSLLWRSPTDCGVSKFDHESPIMSSPWLTRDCCTMEKKNVSSLRRKLRYNCVQNVHDSLVISMGYEIWASVGGKHTLHYQMCFFIVCSSDIIVLEQSDALVEQNSREATARCSDMVLFIYQTTRDHNTEDRDQIIKVSVIDYTLQLLNELLNSSRLCR